MANEKKQSLSLAPCCTCHKTPITSFPPPPPSPRYVRVCWASLGSSHTRSQVSLL